MTARTMPTLAIVCGLLLTGGLPLLAQQDSPAVPAEADELGKVASIKTASADEVRSQVWQWAKERKLDEGLMNQISDLWPEGLVVETGIELLDRLAGTFALVDPEARQLVEFCSQPRKEPFAPDHAWLMDDSRPALLRHNLRLLYGRWLSREQLHDEALVQLEGLTTDQVVDPASLLFYQSVAHHRLLQKEPGMKSIRKLLDEVLDSPQRYTAVAALMYDDLTALKDDSLDHISRRMDDIRRRLDLGRGGPKVRKIEDDVIASLDKLIEEMEKQQQQQQQQQSGSQSPNPAQDSTPLGGRGPGDVDRRNIGSKTGWGDLPPKQRQEALQQIGKDFPAHYREVIEHFFRKLAGEKSPGVEEK